MESSGSTPSPSAEHRGAPRAPVALLLLLAKEDRPRACTGRRLARAGWVRKIGPRDTDAASGVVLDPYAPDPLSSADGERARDRGLLGVDCSWNRLSDRRRYPAAAPWLARAAARRRLPLLRATNPQHFGQVGQLTTAEAFGAALAVLGERERAARLLSGFAGGEAFFRVNAPLLPRYAAADSSDAVRIVEREAFGPLAAAP